MTGLDIQTYEPLNAPLLEMVDTYGQCLSLSRDFVSITIPPTDPDLEEQDEQEKTELDLTSLESFMAIRADLFTLAENSLARFQSQPKPDEIDSNRSELTKRIINILEEMTEIEGRLTSFLGGHLAEMKGTILRLKKTQPVFKRYAYLGGPSHPNRINRHE